MAEIDFMSVLHKSTQRDYLARVNDPDFPKAKAAELAKRLRHYKTRPLLQGGNAAQRLQTLFEQRDPYYHEAAHFTVDTGRPSVNMLVNTIAMQYEMRDLAATEANPNPN